jgi:hypothetical protein
VTAGDSPAAEALREATRAALKGGDALLGVDAHRGVDALLGVARAMIKVALHGAAVGVIEEVIVAVIRETSGVASTPQVFSPVWTVTAMGSLIRTKCRIG